MKATEVLRLVAATLSVCALSAIVVSAGVVVLR